MSLFIRLLLTLGLLLAVPAFGTTSAKKKKTTADTTATASAKDYVGAIVVDASDGKVLFEDNADATAYPASVTKLMNLLLVLEHIESGAGHLDDKITADAEDAKMGGTQVYLKPGEVFTVEELLYGMMIQSANDAALALAKYVAGTREMFVAKMNERAARLGLLRTRFVTPHGLASHGQTPDSSTPRDIATLANAVVHHPLALRFTSAKERVFRKQPLLVIRNHNKLLWQVPGCDGLKTGYLQIAGFSLAATEFRDGKRVIAVVMGSRGGVHGSHRDAITKELMAAALPKASPAPAALQPPEPEAPPAVPAGAPAATGEEETEEQGIHFTIPGSAPAKTKSGGGE